MPKCRFIPFDTFYCHWACDEDWCAKGRLSDEAYTYWADKVTTYFHARENDPVEEPPPAIQPPRPFNLWEAIGHRMQTLEKQSFLNRETDGS